jgi:flagellar biogenesis protein FliO
MARFSTRRLRVSETVSLGEKRFVAVIQIDGLQYLIGGGATNVALLAQLNAKESFGDLLTATMTFPKNQFGEPTAGQTREQS